MKVYKGTDKDIKCRGYQFVPGVEAVEDRAELCEAGFHACEAPLDVLGYYPPGYGSRYFEAELENVSDERHGDDSKVVGKRITLGAEIGIPGLVKAHVKWVKANIDESKKQTVIQGNASSASNTGYASSASNTGNRSSASVAGGGSVALVTGRYSKAKAGLGSAICVCERGDWNGNTLPLIAIKAAIIDGEILKPDTWYKLENGEFVEVEEWFSDMTI